MENIDIKHLDHIKENIVDGIKIEIRQNILAEYSISDQLNASGAAATKMKAAIKEILDEGHLKIGKVASAKTFKQLEAVVPRRKD